MAERAIKAITLHQPWATLFVVGAKTVETRSWPTSYRGPIAIHAAKILPSYAFYASFREPLDSVLKDHGITTPRAILDLPLGVVVAKGRLIMCREIDVVAFAAISPTERACGDFTPGRFAWLIKDIEPVDPPILARGRQRLWKWTVPEGFEL